ncbi:MAG: DUF4332 domain-containing protein [Candidatus Thorarchaeota archaeon]|nr:DUF4332 domain-containing protein [Candidatus Thorarchaeota archaeon]
MAKGILDYREDEKLANYSARISSTIRQIEIFGIRDINELIRTVEDCEECETFIGYSNILFEDLVVLLNCLLRWILPFARPIRDFVDSNNSIHLDHLAKLRKRGISNNLDMIEQCRMPSARETMAVLTHVPRDFILDLVYRTDISRIPYVRGKTVEIFNSAGYNTLNSIANATVEKMIPKLEKSLEDVGKKFSRSFIDPEGAIAQALVLPKLIEL